ncbi:RtcB family protein [Deinococcus saxicola]|uniref:RtcB family protein n=1 Tax=Deinococcus saxicola TaxID=249406 RepID=UPI003D134C95
MIPYGVGVDIGCFPAETLIPLLDGQTSPISGLIGRGLTVYACTPSGKIVAAKAAAKQTRKNALLVQIELDNGQTIRCTPDHRFMLRNGSYLAAEQLYPGTSLMPFYSDRDRDGDVRIQQNHSGRMQKAHWMVARSGLMGEVPRFDGQRTVIHHRDFDEANNDPGNLEFMGDRSHSAYHRSLVERNTMWQLPEFESRRVAALAAKAATPEGHAYFAERGTKNLMAFIEANPGKLSQLARDGGNGVRGMKVLTSDHPAILATRQAVAACPECGREIKSFIGMNRHRKWKHGYNHRVISVTHLDEVADVYCLTVPGYDNFALAAGVFVHNCSMRLSVFAMQPDALKLEEAKTLLLKHTRFGAGVAFEKREREDHEVLHEGTWDDQPILGHLFEKAAAQIGSSGSGNHFAEFGTLTLAQADLGLEAGQYLALLSHSGSRGFGAQVAGHFTTLAERLHPNIDPAAKKLAWLSLDSEEGQAYWQAMNLAGRYALANHELIHARLARALGVGVLASVHNSHNLAWKQNVNGQELIVHRKGATPADRGQLGLIPGSMADPGFVVRGRGQADALASASHGAGRQLGRKAAASKLVRKEVAAYLKERGVTLMGGGIDEAPQAYKRIEDVIARQTDLVDVVAQFTPKVVRMDSGSEDI